MKITRIYIKSFGNLSKKEIIPGEGINIIKGDNESGKSTVAAFLKFMFFGLASRGEKDRLSEKDRYISWSEHMAAGSLYIVKDNGREYRLEREATVAGKKLLDDYTIYDDLTGEVIPSSPDSFFLSGASKELYSGSCFLSGASGSGIKPEEIHSSIENMLSGGDETLNTKKALDALDKAGVALYHKHRNGGRIFELEQKRDSLIAKKNSYRVSYEESERIKLRISELDKRISVLKRELNELEKKIERSEVYERLSRIEKTKELQRELDEAKKELEELERKYTFGDFLPDDVFLQSLKDLIREYDYVSGELGKLCEKKASIEKELKDSEALFTDGSYEEIKKKADSLAMNYHTYKSISAYLLLGTVICLVPAVIFLALSVTVSIIFFVLTAVFGVALGVCLGLKSSIYKTIGKMLEKLGLEDLEALEEKTKYQRSLSEKRMELSALLGLTKQGIIDKKASLTDILKRLKALAYKTGDEISSYGDCALYIKETEKKITLLSEKRLELSRKKDGFRMSHEEYTENEYISLKSKLEDFRGDYFTGSMLAEARDRERALKNEYGSLTEQRSSLKNRYISTVSGIGDSDELENEINSVQDEISRLRASYEAVALARSSLLSASENSRGRIAPSLGTRASEMLSSVSDGKYQKLNVDSDFRITYREDGMTKSIEHLSDGTKDVVYITLRICLCSLLFSDSPAIIFDESFVRLDDTRLENMMELLSDIAREADLQIFILTPTSREERAMSGKNCKVLTL